jgi:hypothetical protein
MRTGLVNNAISQLFAHVLKEETVLIDIQHRFVFVLLVEWVVIVRLRSIHVWVSIAHMVESVYHWMSDNLPSGHVYVAKSIMGIIVN